MGNGAGKHGLHIARGHIVAPAGKGRRLCHGGQRKRGARAGPLHHLRVAARGAHQPHNVLHHSRVHIQSGHLRAQSAQFIVPQHLAHAAQRGPALPAAQKFHFALFRGVAHRKFYHKAVQLRIRQKLCARGTGRVLRGHRHAALLHRL